MGVKVKPRTILAKRLRVMRKKTGLSNEELAKELGISKATAFAWERGDRAPSRKTALRYYNFCKDIARTKLEDFL